MGNQQALDDLTERLYTELHQLAASDLRNERRDHTRRPTALVNQAYLLPLEQTQPPSCQNRSHVFGIAAQLMRQTLVFAEAWLHRQMS